jgi:hypothetical protein
VATPQTANDDYEEVPFPVRDSITGEIIEENIPKNAKAIYARLQARAAQEELTSHTVSPATESPMRRFRGRITERLATWLAAAAFVSAATVFMGLLSLLGYRLETRDGDFTVFVYAGLLFAGFVTRLVFDRLMTPKGEEEHYSSYKPLPFEGKLTVYLSLLVTVLFTVCVCIVIALGPWRPIVTLALVALSLGIVIILAVKAHGAIVTYASRRPTEE